MKKSITFLLVCALSLFIVFPAFASTISVNVDPGFTISLEKQLSPSSDPFTLTGEYGISEQFLIKASYTNDNPTEWAAGIRCELAENIAFTVDYDTQDTSHETTIGLRGKMGLSDNLALVGQLDYISTYVDPDTTSSYSLLGQAEYALNEVFTVNGGLKFVNESGTTTTSYLVGGEFNANEKLCVYFDYEKASGSDGTFLAGVSYSF